MLINELEKAIKESVTDWKEYLEADFKTTITMVQIGGGQKGFTEWLIGRIKKNGQDGWWYPSTLFRSFDKKVDEANQIRAKIRAATDGKCPFIGRKAWNKNENKEIFREWISKNSHLVEQAHRLNEGCLESTSMVSNNSNYLPTKEDCDSAIRQLHNENLHGTTDTVLDRIEENVTSKGMTLKPNWRIITEENMKKWATESCVL